MPACSACGTPTDERKILVTWAGLRCEVCYRKDMKEAQRLYARDTRREYQ